jgi:putative Holliday junction resolvase
LVYQDEHLTSQKASEIIFQSGVGKMKRRDKGLVDKVSAVLILQEYLGHLKDVYMP